MVVPALREPVVPGLRRGGWSSLQVVYTKSAFLLLSFQRSYCVDTGLGSSHFGRMSNFVVSLRKAFCNAFFTHYSKEFQHILL
jgi:hypothetical protein